MLDTLTLRVAFGVLGMCTVVLSYGVTYRTTRSSYSGWWCLSLALFFVGAVLYLANGTALQVAANPAGNTVAVLGAGCVWAAARSLRGRTTAWWQLAAAPAVVLVASLLDDPAHDIWTGGPFFLAGMALMLGLSAAELRAVVRTADPARAQAHFTLWSLTLTSGLVAVFYLLRAIVFVAVGPDHIVFRGAFGSQVTTLLTLVLLIVVTFSMSEMSHVEQTTDLREQAAHDPLTGVLNRTEFLRLAEQAFASGNGPSAHREAAVVVADLDDFKALNDAGGHAAGDAALTRFAAACVEEVDGIGLVGRLGGDEFALYLPDLARAPEVAEQIRDRFTRTAAGAPGTTVSFGIAPADRSLGVKDSIVRADVALYQAKAAGRDRVVVYVDKR